MLSRISIVALLALIVAGFGGAPTVASPDAQLNVIKELRPGLARVGVILSEEALTESLVGELMAAKASSGVELFIMPVYDMSSVAPALRDLQSKEIDVLWVVDGSGVLASGPARSYLIQNATKARTPIFAPGQDWVEAGATVAIDAAGGEVHLYVNDGATKATKLSIPAAYADRTTVVR